MKSSVDQNPIFLLHVNLLDINVFNNKSYRDLKLENRKIFFRC